MPDHTSAWVHGNSARVRSCGLCGVRRDLFSARKNTFATGNCSHGAFEITSLCGVGAAGTDQEMLHQQHQHFIIFWDPKKGCHAA